MEGLTRLVSESLARHGFDRPLDYRRLHWSRWFRCNSHHSLLFVPSKPGVFAVAEEVMDLSRMNDPVATAASAVPRSAASGRACDAASRTTNLEERSFDATIDVEERRFSAASDRPSIAALAAGAITPEAERPNPEAPRRMLAVTQFFEDDDMAYVLDRMLSQQNPMAARLASGRYFVRFVVIEDQTQRRSICSALNQWMVSAAEKASGIGSHFATSLELTPATEYIPQPDDRQQSLFPTKKEDGNVAQTAAADIPNTHVAADAFVRPPVQNATDSVWDRVSDPVEPSEARQDFSDATNTHVATAASAAPQSEASGSHAKPGFRASHQSPTAPHLNSGAATNIHCPSPFPSGF
jgi:hypothetical protein